MLGVKKNQNQKYFLPQRVSSQNNKFCLVVVLWYC